MKLDACPESRWDYASLGDYATPSIPSAMDPRRAPCDPGRICSAQMLACTVKTLRENYEIVMQQLSVKFALLLKVVLPGAGLERQMTWLPGLNYCSRQWVTLASGIQPVTDVDEEGASKAGVQAVGKITLELPLVSRPLLVALQQAHDEAVADGPNADVVCQGLCLAWACGTMKYALVYDIFHLVTMSEVCSCHGRKRKHSRSDDSGLLEAASRILAEEDSDKAGVADDSEAITINDFTCSHCVCYSCLLLSSFILSLLWVL